MHRAIGSVPRLRGEQGATLLPAVLSFPSPGHACCPRVHADGRAALCPGAEDGPRAAISTHFAGQPHGPGSLKGHLLSSLSESG